MTLALTGFSGTAYLDKTYTSFGTWALADYAYLHFQLATCVLQDEPAYIRRFFADPPESTQSESARSLHPTGFSQIFPIIQGRSDKKPYTTRWLSAKPPSTSNTTIAKFAAAVENPLLFL
ncbi:unnamed protein product [Protopolystoma xenopodis]|uniref:Uncharacterized protein n=1 Tax=Protopolystoma xenopodis TaxID=117903 RepID=A0A3S4ZRU9_9PLAT|nr:unnamed protein product [Protopolystoma xenopodis]